MGGIEGPFIGTEALAAGLVSRRGLSSGYNVIYRNALYPGTDKMCMVLL